MGRSGTRVICAITAPLILGALAAPGRGQQGDPWLGADEPSSFLPDGARWVGEPAPRPEGWTHTVYFRGTVSVEAEVTRAVLCAAPSQTVEVRLNGTLVATAYEHLEALPVFAEVGEKLAVGRNVLTAKVYSEWRPVLYIQLRVQYDDGLWEDLCTGAGWEVCSQATEAWRAGGNEAGQWVAAADAGGYYRAAGEGPWGREFALLPREGVAEHFESHNQALRAAWAQDRAGPFSEFRGEYEAPDLAERYAAFWRLNPQTGQLLDAQGRDIHLFFTIYNQMRDGGVVMTVPQFDFDQLERDLDLMAPAHVNLYMRQFGWDQLLDERGQWRVLEEQPAGTGLPRLGLVRDVYDYFLDRVQAHGLHVLFEADFYWSAHPDVVLPPYRTRYHLYPEVLYAHALPTRKMMNYFSRRPCVLGYMAGEEEIGLAYDLDNPHFAQRYREHLQRKYGSVEAFIRSHPGGCDYKDLSAYRAGRRAAEYWEGQPEEDVLFPVLPWRQGLFDRVQDWADVPLPHWPQYRSPGDPSVALAAHKSYNEFSPDDPLWIDYYEARDEELLFDMLCRWARTVREGCPQQLLFYSNAQDFTASWHFLHLFNRAGLPFDVIGVGCHDSGIDPADLEPWATTRKYIKVIASYRPYVHAQGALPVGIASGEGEGGKAEHPEEVLDYYRGALFDEIGGGAAWTQTYTWLHISGGDAETAPHETPLLAWMAEFMPAHERDPFPLRDNVPLLIVRNQNLQHSNRSGLDYGNTLSLAHYLTQLNIEFDIAMDQALTYQADRPFSINISGYRVIFVPTVACDFPDEVWETLDAWLSDPRSAGQRALCVGLGENRSPYMAPQDEFHPMLQKWLGCRDHVARGVLTGPQTLTCAQPFGEHEPGDELSIDFGPRQYAPASRCGFFGSEDALLRLTDGRVIAMSRQYAGNRVYGFGFFLGLAYSDLWGMEAPQETYDAPTALFESIITDAGLERNIRAPHNVRVYVSADGRTILVRERYCLETDAQIDVRLPDDVRYPNGERLPDGFMRFRVSLEPYEGVVLSAD